MKKMIRNMLDRAGYALFNTRKHHGRDGLFTLHNDHFRNDAAFAAAYRRGLQASNGVDPQMEWRVHIALWAASVAVRLTGDFVECGVNAGFISSAILHRLNWRTVQKRFYLIDTFKGPVVSQYSQDEIARGRLKIAEDAIAAGAYATDIAAVRANFAEWPNAIVAQGIVPDVLSVLEIRKVAFLHIDLNCAAPERAALEYFWKRLSPGALVLLDDYAWLGHDAQMHAIDDAAASLGCEVLSLPTGQGLVIK